MRDAFELQRSPAAGLRAPEDWKDLPEKKQNAVIATLRNFAEPLPGVTLSQGRGDPLQELSDYVGLGTLCVADRSAPVANRSERPDG